LVGVHTGVWDRHVRRGGLAAIVALLGALGWVASARADDWLPDTAGAKWQYKWSDSAYNPQGTIENVDVQQVQGSSFTLAWADPADQLPAAGQGPTCFADGTSDVGVMTFQNTDSGLINLNWNGCPPASMMPILCSAAAGCANSLSSALFNLIWGDRVPVLSEPLLQGTTWNATGGSLNDVQSTSRYLGHQLVKVPAFPGGVVAAVVRTDIAEAGELGDPYGSGTRTTWWVDGVGPVKISFDHVGGQPGGAGPAPITSVSLLSTSLTPVAPPPDTNWFPLTVGLKNRYRWTNSKHLPKPEVETMTVTQSANRSAAVSVKSNSGPLRAAAAYTFTTRLDGVSDLSGQSSAATLAKLPKLGHGRHFFTPIDLLVFGFNPVLTAYPAAGQSWASGNAHDFSVFGVTGRTTVVGIHNVKVPAGQFRALEVRTTLTQKGHPFGSGVRTAWFAPGRGLVKLVFQHADGSTSVVQLLK
jgi:hypothetical protein